jgi:hypothetical protein
MLWGSEEGYRWFEVSGWGGNMGTHMGRHIGRHMGRHMARVPGGLCSMGWDWSDWERVGEGVFWMSNLSFLDFFTWTSRLFVFVVVIVLFLCETNVCLVMIGSSVGV